MTTINHWSKWIDSEKPVTGVINNNTASQFISDEMYNGIDLTWEEFTKSNDYDPDVEYDFFESDTYLIGDWIKDADGLYTHDPNGEYAAIVNNDSNTTQIVFSKYTKKAAVCSPCYPGQCDLDSSGEFLTYDLPPSAYEY